MHWAGLMCVLGAALLQSPADRVDEAPAWTVSQDPKPPKGNSQDQVKAVPEYELKAGFLFQFAKYVEWPEAAFDGPKAPIVIGIVGQDPFGDALERILKNKAVRGRSFRLERFSGIGDIKSCHILFVSHADKVGIEAIAKHLGKAPTLTVGEVASFAKDGGAIAIVVKDDKPRLEVNVEAATSAGLTIDARLLKAATVVAKEK